MLLIGPSGIFEQKTLDVHISLTSSHNWESIIVICADSIVVFLTGFRCLIIARDQFPSKI